MNKEDQEFLVNRIRAQYMEQEHTKLDELKNLDAKVKRPATIFGYVFGVIGTLILGLGMSLILTDIASIVGISNPMATGTIVGLVGLVMVLINYPIYKRILASRRKKYANEIIELSEKFLDSHEKVE